MDHSLAHLNFMHFTYTANTAHCFELCVNDKKPKCIKKYLHGKYQYMRISTVVKTFVNQNFLK